MSKMQILSLKRWNYGYHTKNTTSTSSKRNQEDEPYYVTKKES